MSNKLYNFFPTKAEEVAAAAAAASLLEANRWPIRKVLTIPDVGARSRLNLPQGCEHSREIQENIISYLHPDTAREVLAGGKQIIKMKDVDDGTDIANMIITSDPATNTFYLQGYWRSKFTVRRNLQAGDEIGLRWNVEECCLEFSKLN